jgi:hypothetical protein
MDHTKKFVLVDPIAYSRLQAPIQTHAQTIVPNTTSQLDSEVRNILNGDDPDDIKVKRYGMILKKFRVREPIKRDEQEKIDEEEILESVPSAIRYKAKRLIRIVKENPQLAWNERGELVYKQTTIVGSNIVELFNDVLKQKRAGEDKPRGWKEFAEGLTESNDVSKDLISNYASWKVINERRRPTSPVAHVPSAETSARKSRSITRTRARHRRISWEEY